MPPSSENQVSAHGVQNGRNILSLDLDFLNSKDGKAVFEGLIKWADIYIESSRPGTLDRHGLSDSVLKKLNKKLSVIHLSGFGQTGSKRNDPSHDLDIYKHILVLRA